ncbi:hypothetical protein HNP84_000524 [Thermocatellispora tengchongensis]|uniref:Uncharacterized protein n=1 Tax=Thermocatellispora tengchongensis TaxID=1073253 RepID=A0A840NXA2_9ACTN|nr:hypothetical protein [Thermocatellispora tengchongensis]MBB5130836.1 hypothetical protein [Thermocatellispora tengchongensis]
MQGWWANLLQGALSAVIGGIVAAITAWAVVTATRRHERRAALEIEARTSAIEFFLLLADIDTQLTKALDNQATVPHITDSKEWTLKALKAEIAMFSLGQEVGNAFSQKIGDLRRALELAEGDNPPKEQLVTASLEALHACADHLAEWLMQGRHRSESTPTKAKL